MALLNPESFPGLLGHRPNLAQRVLGGLGQVFGGMDDPNLSAQQNAMARRRAIMQAGLATMAAGSQPGASTLGALAQGAMFGQQSGEQNRAQQMQQAQQQQLAQLANNGQLTPDALQKIFQHAVATGNPALANAAVGWMNAMRPEANNDIIAAGEGNRFLIRRSTGEVVRDLGAQTTARAPERYTDEWFKARERELKLEQKYRPIPRSSGGAPRAFVDPETGQTRFGVFDPETNSFIPIEGAAPVQGTGSEGERKAAAFAGFVPEHIAFVDSLAAAPTRVEQALSNKGLREFTADEQQQLRLAGSAMAEAWLRMTTGAAYNEREFQTAFEMFVPQPGDKSGALDVKRRNRERLQGMLGQLAGRAGGVTSSVGGGTEQTDEQRLIGQINMDPSLTVEQKQQLILKIGQKNRRR